MRSRRTWRSLLRTYDGLCRPQKVLKSYIIWRTATRDLIVHRYSTLLQCCGEKVREKSWTKKENHYYIILYNFTPEIQYCAFII